VTNSYFRSLIGQHWTAVYFIEKKKKKNASSSSSLSQLIIVDILAIFIG
jgi:hypothetical protein